MSWIRHLCNGGLHGVGVTSKGHLIFSHHTMHELKREVALSEMGTSICKCANMLLAWRKGEEGKIPRELKCARAYWGNRLTAQLASRIVGRRRKRTDIFDARYDALESLSGDYADAARAARLMEALVARGWALVEDKDGARGLCLSKTSLPVTLRAGRIVGNETYSSEKKTEKLPSLTMGYSDSALYESKYYTPISFHAYRVRMGLAVDQIEKHLFCILLDQAEKDALAAMQKSKDDEDLLEESVATLEENNCHLSLRIGRQLYDLAPGEDNDKKMSIDLDVRGLTKSSTVWIFKQIEKYLLPRIDMAAKRSDASVLNRGDRLPFKHKDK